MQMVESVLQDAKCMLSGLQARSEIATQLITNKLTSATVTFPSFKTSPVFHDVWFFLSLTTFEGVLRILSGEVAIAAKLAGLES